VRSLTLSVPVGLKVMSVPRFPVEPAVAVAGVSVTATGLIEAPAAGASAAIAPTTAAHRAIRRFIVAECFPAGRELNPPRPRTRPGTATPSGVLDDDALDDVGRSLGGVDGGFQALEDVLPADDDHGVDPAVEQGGHRLTRDPVALVLQAVDLDRVAADVAEPAQVGDGLRDLA